MKRIESQNHYDKKEIHPNQLDDPYTDISYLSSISNEGLDLISPIHIF
jgi:hypothetical protein